ncbi:universal stress protein [Pontibacter sp. G13]|uniref:universal stress protein n=1 Tax=Pontibacter sp. G13 TaxID=3074898 RepID=UPI00288B815C|nr:universal stress protein [Pontibacter sp. G13]WNJ18051.1 universal stress protein [Pontibacter sp. G13]
MERTFLIPTDFSDESDQAIRYGLQLAQVFDARTILCHACNLAMPADPMEADHTAATTYQSHLDAIQLKLDAQVGRVWEDEEEAPPQTLTKIGFAADVILHTSEQAFTDLVILASHGKEHGQVQWLGGISSRVVQESRVPILIVPPGCKFRPFRSVAWALEMGRPFHANPMTERLQEVFEPEWLMVNVYGDQMPSLELRERMSHQISGQIPQWHYSEFLYQSDRVAKGLWDFVREYEADLLVVTPHKRSWWQSWFHPSQTQRLARLVTCPMLVLPAI